MEFENLVRLIQTVSDSGLTELKYEEDGVKLLLSQKQSKVQVISGITSHMENPEAVLRTHHTLSGLPEQADMTAGDMGASRQVAAAEGHVVASPLVGVFYAAPAEDAQPFVAVGDHVKKGQTLAIVEAMKLMNDIECEFDGTVAEILVKNGQPVEYGQPLFRII